VTAFRQPDQRSCGAAVLVRARMLADPAYDAWVRAAGDPAERFADEALRTHRRTNRPLDGRGRPQLPWPRALGTQPWALARELPGEQQVHLALDRAAAWARLVRAGQPAPLYVGDGWLPRHVVLVTGRHSAARLRVYEPSSGATVGVDRPDFLAGALGLGGWDRPWFVVA
jgi:hypothetical protein